MSSGFWSSRASRQYRGRRRLCMAGYPAESSRRVSPRRHHRRHLRITIDRPLPRRAAAGRGGLRPWVSAVGSRSTSDVRGCAWRWTGCGLRGIDNAATKRGAQSSRQRTSIHVPAYVVRIPPHPRRIRRPGGRPRHRPSPPADHDQPSASSEGGGETGWSSRSLGAVPRTYGVVYGGGMAAVR